MIPALEERSIPTASVLRDAKPSALDDDRLVLEFPPSASFHRALAEEPKHAGLLAEVLHEVVGRRLSLTFAVGEAEPTAEDDEPELTDEEGFVSLMKDTFDAREMRED